jgi:hypothetical protein
METRLVNASLLRRLKQIAIEEHIHNEGEPSLQCGQLRYDE